MKTISLSQFKEQIDRINYPMTAEDAATLKNATRRRMLQDVTALNSSDSATKGVANASNVRSGGKIPDFYIAHVDKYG